MSTMPPMDRKEALAIFTLATVAGHFRRLQGRAERAGDAADVVRLAAYATVADYLLWRRLAPRANLRDFLLARLIPWERVAERLVESCDRSPLWDELLRALGEVVPEADEANPS